jgi:hypothetical protein
MPASMSKAMFFRCRVCCSITAFGMGMIGALMHSFPFGRRTRAHSFQTAIMSAR